MIESIPQLTCERCKKRKIRCDKLSPCSACRNVGVTCESVQRARLPRGRSGRVHKNTLETRVSRIESLLKQAQGASTTGWDCISAGPLSSSLSSKVGDFVAPDFWTALSQEVSGLRETFESSDEEDASPAAVSGVLKPTSSEIIALFGLNPFEALPGWLSPTMRVRTTLLDLYKQRVDCLYKILHWPTVLRDIELAHADPDNPPQSPSAQALESAIYFMALCSITDEETAHLDLGNRLDLTQQYRVATELSISEANLLRNPNVTVLQAFVIYLIGLRAHQNCASEWTLLAVAVRVASALRLGQESPTKFSAFDLELRRRLWYCIALMDTHASMDRGTTPMLRYADIGPPPVCINDEDMSPTFVPKTSSSGFTDVSFFAMMFKAMACHKKMLDMAGTTEEQWREKLQLILDFETSMHQSYIDISDSASTLERLAKFAAMEITVSMHLLLRRPPYKQQREAVPQWDDFDVFEVATAVIDRHLQVKSAEFAQWGWKSWVQWHALAVLLAELSSRPPGPNTDRAYLIACKSFSSYARVIADSESGMLWKPIAKLMRRVQRLRQNIPLTPDLTLSHVPTAPSTDSGRILDFAGNSSNISEFGFPEPIPSTCELPDSLEWCVNNNAGNLCMNEVDQTMSIYNDPELN